MARRSTQPRELVRLTPLQFSLSVSIVVLLAAGTGLAGYIYGYRKAMEGPETGQQSAVTDQEVIAPGGRSGADSQATVTFYTALTEPRADTPDKQDLLSPETQRTATATATNAATSPPPIAPSLRKEDGRLMLQVASYKKAEAASKLLESLSGEGYAGTVVRADLGDRGIWYRVRVGPYSGEQEAKRVLSKLRKERNLKGFVVHGEQ